MEDLTIDEMMLTDPALRREVLERAVNDAWSAIACASIDETDDELDWMDLGIDHDSVRAEVDFLARLGLLMRHPDKPDWVREAAEL